MQVSAAQSYLLAAREANGLWQETFQGALAMVALTSTLTDLTALQGGIAALRGQQLTDGSWDGDGYTTALALRALWYADKPPSKSILSAIRGIVVDGVTGLPLAGVNVLLSGVASATLTTGSDGVFEFRDLPVGSYSLQWGLSGYASLTGSAFTTFGQTLDFGQLRMSKTLNTTTGTVFGVVKDGATGQGLTGASVELSGLGLSAVTDSAGSYQITDVPTGTVTVLASKSGYSAATGVATMTAGGLMVFSPTLTSVTTPVTALQGTVTDGITGLALSGVSVNVSGDTTAMATTDVNGAYRIEGLNPGAMTITVSADGYASVSEFLADALSAGWRASRRQ